MVQRHADGRAKGSDVPCADCRADTPECAGGPFRQRSDFASPATPRIGGLVHARHRHSPAGRVNSSVKSCRSVADSDRAGRSPPDLGMVSAPVRNYSCGNAVTRDFARDHLRSATSGKEHHAEQDERPAPIPTMFFNRRTSHHPLGPSGWVFFRFRGAGSGDQRTSKTGVLQAASTLVATEPSTRLAIDEWPCEPITTRSASCSSASLVMTSAA